MTTPLRVRELALGRDRDVEALLSFARAHGTPRRDNVVEHRAALADASDVLQLLAEDDAGQAHAAIVASVTPTLGAEVAHTNGYLTPGSVRALAVVEEGAADWARRLGVERMVVHVSDPRHDEVDAWLELGYRQVGARARVTRRVEPGDAQRVPSAVPGIRIVALADQPALEPAVERLWFAAHRDVPSVIAFGSREDVTMRADLSLDGDAPLPGSLLVAVDVDSGGPVGVAYLHVHADRRVAGHRFTGVAHRARGRGIARALKVELIRWAARAGIELLQASNDEDNAPMRRVNARLGYREEYRIVMLERQLRADARSR